MRRNLFLLALVGILLWGAWYREHRVEEVPGVFGFVHWDEIVSLETSGAVLKKESDRWVAAGSGREVDGEKIRELWSVLQMVGTEREITNEDILLSEAFPPSSERLVIHFKQGRLEMLLGRKLRFSDSFYLKTVDIRHDRRTIRRWVAQDHSLEPGIYNVKTVHRSPVKYQRLKSLLQLKENEFYKEERS